MTDMGDGVRTQSRCPAVLFQPDFWRPHHAITHTILSTRSMSSKSLSPKWLKQGSGYYSKTLNATNNGNREHLKLEENAERSSCLQSYRWANRVEGAVKHGVGREGGQPRSQQSEQWMRRRRRGRQRGDGTDKHSQSATWHNLEIRRAHAATHVWSNTQSIHTALCMQGKQIHLLNRCCYIRYMLMNTG